MKSQRILFLVGLSFILTFSSLIYADVPQMINYQGKITTPDGALIDGTFDMVFSIYNVATGGTPIWTETQTGVVVEKGVFSVLLGSVTPIPCTIFDGTVKYLGVKVSTDPEMTPRKEIVSVAYACRAGGDGDWTISGSDMYSAVSGKVGIGTTSPSEKLHVDGNAEVTGRINKARFGTDWVFSNQCRLAVDMAGDNVDNGEVHFGNTGNNQWVDMWFQYSNGYLMGNYIKYDGSTMTTGHFRLGSSGIILYSGTDAANSAGHAYWDKSNYDVLICENSAGNGFCEYWYSEQRHQD